MRPHSFARKQRQLAASSKQLQQQLERGHSPAAPAVRRLVLRIRRLLSQLSEFLTASRLRKSLGAVAILFGLGSTTASAQTFGPPQTNPFGLQNVGQFGTVALVDIDNDGDFDLFTGQYAAGTSFFENTGTATSPTFAAPQAGQFGLSGNAGVTDRFTFVDIDNDGDFDNFMGTDAGDDFDYNANTGSATNPAFAMGQTNPFGLTTIQSYDLGCALADMDNDGDFDMYALERVYGVKQMVYFENTGTASAPAFGSKQVSPFGADLSGIAIPHMPNLGDLDGDGDLDLVVGGYYGDQFYFENTGTATAPAFGTPQTNPFGLTNVGGHATPAFVDMDGDGDLDVMLANRAGNIIYYENTTPLSVAAPVAPAIRVWPTATNGLLKVATDAQLRSMEVLSMTGQRWVAFLPHVRMLKVDFLPAGNYLLRFHLEDGTAITRKFVRL